MSSSRRRKANKSNVSGPSSRTEFKTAIVGGSVPSVSSTRLTEFKTPESNIPVELKSNGSTGVQFPKWRTSEFSAPEYSRISPKIPARGSSRSSDAKKRKRSKISKDASEISKDNPKIVAPKSKSILASEKVENSLSVVNKGKPPLTRRDIPEPISLNLYAAPQTYNYNLRSDDPYKIVRLYIPILACLFLVLLSVMAIPYFRATFQLNDPSTLLPEDDADAPWLKQPPSYVILPEPTLILKSDSLELTDNPWFIILVIVVFLVMLVVCSISLLCLYKYEWYKTITALFILAFLVYLLAFPMVYIQELIYIANIPLDYFTLSFLLYNYVASGLIVLFVSGPKLMKQFYHVLTCAALALFLIKLLNEWMTVGLLIVMLLWDLYAVLHTQGPLNNLLTLLQNKGNSMPPIVFQMSIWMQLEMPNPKQEQTKTTFSTTHRQAQADSGEFEIGLGDFIFFSLLVGKCYMYAGLLGALFTIVAVITGLTLTLFLLIVLDYPLPALPIPITFGLIVWLLTQYCAEPFAQSLNSNTIYV